MPCAASLFLTKPEQVSSTLADLRPDKKKGKRVRALTGACVLFFEPA
jgi:hypothetical protein